MFLRCRSWSATRCSPHQPLLGGEMHGGEADQLIRSAATASGAIASRMPMAMARSVSPDAHAARRSPGCRSRAPVLQASGGDIATISFGRIARRPTGTGSCRTASRGTSRCRRRRAAQYSIELAACSCQTAMPMLAPTDTGWAPKSSGWASAAINRCATRPASLIRQLRQQHGELVAADAGQCVTVANAALQPLPDELQRNVADVVAIGIVHCLEAVEIEHQHGKHAAVPPRVQHRLVQPVSEQRAVRQSGQRVGVGEVGELFARAMQVGDVGGEATTVGVRLVNAFQVGAPDRTAAVRRADRGRSSG